VPRRRGRPKGSKNKPKTGAVIASASSLVGATASEFIAPQLVNNEVVVSLPVKAVEINLPVQSHEASELSLDGHPVIQAAKWLERKMPVVEIQYYKTRAAKQGVGVTNSIAMAILGLFNVQDQEIRKHAKI
jgi:hypothetical protein